MIYYVDIDETICEYGESRHYPEATPIKSNIDKINLLFDEGAHCGVLDSPGFNDRH